jgi:hypothetical protein
MGLSVIAAGAARSAACSRRPTPPAAAASATTPRWEGRRYQKILATCKKYKKPCAYPVNENDIETRYSQGFNVGILQSFNDMAFRAVAKGRAIAGRDNSRCL